MNKAVRSSAIGLLFFLGVSALLGAVAMIIDPTGEGMGLPPEILEGLPFNSYLIPGILLGSFNGLLSIVIAILVIRKIKQQGWLVIFQGCVLIVWMTAEMVMGLYYPSLTIPYYVLGLLLVLFGILIIKTKPQ